MRYEGWEAFCPRHGPCSWIRVCENKEVENDDLSMIGTLDNHGENEEDVVIRILMAQCNTCFPHTPSLFS